MIRINLLAVEPRAMKRGVLIPSPYRVAIAASLILLATMLSVGWWFWSLRQTSRKLDEDLARIEAETQLLRSVLSQVQALEGRRAQLQQRITLIEQLRRRQIRPVHVLDEIARAVPDRLWLIELSQKGDELMLAGMTTALTGVTDFVANLENSGWFRKPVDIVDSERSSDSTAGDLVKFSVKATVNNESPVQPPER